MPEGDSLHRAARRLQPLVGEIVEIETPHPQAQVTRVAERLGPRRRLESVEAVGKNLLLRFEGGLVVRSHLRMNGRWYVQPVEKPVLGRPWLVLRGERMQALQFNGPVLRVDDDVARRLGPDVLAAEPDVEAMLARLRGADPALPLGEALQNQRLVSGIGNMWMAEALWEARLSPWLRVGEATDEQLRAALEAAVRLHARLARGPSRRPSRLPPGRATVPAVRRCDPLARPGRRESNRVLVPRLPGRGRSGAARGVRGGVAFRAPHLYDSLRRFCLGAFSVLSRDLDEGAELPFAFEAHESDGRPALYEYRPLARGFVEARADRLVRREDALMALDDLRAEPAAAIFARAHAPGESDDDRALVYSVLMPLLVKVAEASGCFDWDDDAFDRAYAEFEQALFGDRHGYVAVAPLVGLSAAATIELGEGLRVRRAATNELSAHWPEANGLLPPAFGREADRLCVLELERPLEGAGAEPPDAPGELADAVSAIRLATSGAVAAGPVLFERLDWRPYGVRPVVPIAGTQPSGDPTRLDAFRGRLAADLVGRLSLADEDLELGEALDRWELALFQAEPFRSESLRESLVALLGGTDGLWAASVRCALLLGETPRERADLLAGLNAVAGGEPAGASVVDAIRRSLVEALVHGDRPRLVEALDEALLGLRPRPTGYFARLASVGPSGASVAA